MAEACYFHYKRSALLPNPASGQGETMITRRVFLKLTAQAAALSAFYPVLGGTSPMQTGFIYDPFFLKHNLGPGHPERPERLQRLLSVFESSGLLAKLKSQQIAAEISPYLQQVHTEDHIDAISALEPTGAVAHKAVSAICSGARAVSEGAVRNCFCAIRPPGHHANNNLGEEGFCFYSNAAVLARFIQQELGHKKVLIIDWDFHHGNGTENAFYADSSVFFFSTHNQFSYPGTARNDRTGSGAGKGFTMNRHLDAGATDSDMLQIWDQDFLPAARAFAPDFIIISAGFDSRKDDLLGNFSLTDEAFRQMTLRVLELARHSCDGRIVSILEGGYNLDGLALAAHAHVQTLLYGEQAPSAVAYDGRAIHVYGGEAQVVISDVSGRTVYQGKKPVRSMNLAGLGIPAGYYLVQTRYADGTTQVQPLDLLR